MDLEKLVKERLNCHAKCTGHCQEPSTLKFLLHKGMMIGCYTCSSGYVSFIVQYGKELDLHAFKTFLSLLQGDVVDEDIRIATRYSWDLGIKCDHEGTVVKEAYWRQSYRRTKSDDSHRVALFLCTKCCSLYHQRISDKNTFCPKCRESVT
jgi:hypothetical protein